MSHHEDSEAYRRYVDDLVDDDKKSPFLADFLCGLVEMHPVQARAWLKEALAYPDETLAKIMGGMDFADWLAERAGSMADEAVERAQDEQQDAMEDRR